MNPSPDSNLPPRYVTVRLPRVRPFVTYVLMGLCIAVFALQLLSETVLGNDWPLLLGAKVNELIIDGQLWRLLTPVFLHGSLLHIFFNMYALYSFGPSLESSYGHWRFLALYFLAGFSGNVLSFLFTEAPSVGSSTAIFGLLGAEGVFLFRNRRLFGAMARTMLINVAVVAAINLGLGMSPGIDNWGHLGGLLGGSFFAWFAGPVYQLEDEYLQPRLVDEHTSTHSLAAGLAGFVIFAGLAAMKIFQ
ncbi:MAG: rhomboid family intramembrane serine protease [Chloroflexota bacterium]